MSRHDRAAWKSHAHKQFERWAETYDDSILNRLLFRRCYLKFIELIVRDGGLNGGDEKRLVDVGCGTGTFVSMLAETDLPIRSVGLDMSTRMCCVASQKITAVGLQDQVSFLAGDAEHLPFAENSIDVITCSNSFHHYPHQREVLRAMWRVLRPGGKLIILDGFRDNAIGWFVFDVAVAWVEKAVHHCSAHEMRDMMIGSGFDNIYQEKFGFWAPVLTTVGVKAIPSA